MPPHAAAAQLVAMGFDNDAATAALERCRGDLDEAVLLLTCDPQAAPPRQKQQRIEADSSGDDEPPPVDEPQVKLGRTSEAWDQLPQDVLEVVGRWLAVHLGDPPKRQGTTAPEFLHPMVVFRDKFLVGRARLQTTLEKLTAMRTCRQTCRAWRSEIVYSQVRELALDGVQVNPKTWSFGPAKTSSPASNQLSLAEMRDAGTRSTVTHTWWPSNRPIFAQLFDPGCSRFSVEDRAKAKRVTENLLSERQLAHTITQPLSPTPHTQERLEETRGELSRLQWQLTCRVICPICGPSAAMDHAMDAIYANDATWQNNAERSNPANWMANPEIGRHCPDRIFVGPLARGGADSCAECQIPIEPRRKRYACRLDCKQCYCPSCAIGDYASVARATNIESQFEGLNILDDINILCDLAKASPDGDRSRPSTPHQILPADFGSRRFTQLARLR